MGFLKLIKFKLTKEIFKNVFIFLGTRTTVSSFGGTTDSAFATNPSDSLNYANKAGLTTQEQILVCISLKSFILIGHVISLKSFVLFDAMISFLSCVSMEAAHWSDYYDGTMILAVPCY